MMVGHFEFLSLAHSHSPKITLWIIFYPLLLLLAGDDEEEIHSHSGRRQEGPGWGALRGARVPESSLPARIPSH